MSWATPLGLEFDTAGAGIDADDEPGLVLFEANDWLEAAVSGAAGVDVVVTEGLAACLGLSTSFCWELTALALLLSSSSSEPLSSTSFLRAVKGAC
jgi:hypothetical protein